MGNTHKEKPHTLFDFLLDVGSTFIKAAVYDRMSGTIVREERLPFPEPSDRNGAHFVVPESEIGAALDHMMEVAYCEGCTRVFVSVQMHGYFLRKNVDGLFSDYVSWRDRRGDPTDPRLAVLDIRRTGMSLKSNLSVIALLARHDSFEETEFFTLGSYFANRYAGVNATHITDACGTGLYFADTLERVPVFPELRLPRVGNTITAVGTFRDMEIFSSAGDHQVSFLGSGVGEDAVLLNIGTGTQLCALVTKDTPVSAHCEARPYFDSTKRLLTRSDLTGGAGLFAGADADEFVSAALEALADFPPREELVLGGGGAKLVYQRLRDAVSLRGMRCRLLDKTIGFEGLKKLAD